MKKLLFLCSLILSLNVAADQIDTWSSPPDTLSNTSIDSSNPQIGMDSSGNVVAIWLENDVVVAQTKLLNNSWSSSTTISSTGASSPSLVVDPAGNAIAIWIESGVVMSADLPFSGSWSSAAALSGSGTSDPQLAVRSNGDAVAVWVSGSGIESATKIFSMSWSATPDSLSASGADFPQIAVGSDGTVVAVWHSVNGMTSIDNIFAATKAISGSWSVAQPVSDSAIKSAYPQVAVDPNGNALAVWYKFEISGSVFSNVFLQSSLLAPSSSWTIPATLSSGGGFQDPANLVSRVVFSDNGGAMAVWTNSYFQEQYTIESSNTTDLTTWSPALTVLSNLYTYSLDIATDSIGDAFAAYMVFDNINSVVAIQEIETRVSGATSGFWQNPYTLSSGDHSGFPQIAATLSGGTDCYGAVIWVNSDSGTNIIQAVVGTGTAVVPPSSPMVAQNVNSFGIFDEYVNTISWTASTDPNLVAYSVYRNGVLLTSVGSGTLQYDDHNQVQNGPVTYGIGAIDIFSTESNIVTVSFP